MNMATASGRNLFPDNFAREVFPQFPFAFIDREVHFRIGFEESQKEE